MSDFLQQAADFILNEELASDTLAKSKGRERTSTYIDPIIATRKKGSSKRFDEEQQKLINLKGSDQFDSKFEAWRKEFLPTVVGTNAGDDNRWKELQSTFRS